MDFKIKPIKTHKMKKENEATKAANPPGLNIDSVVRSVPNIRFIGTPMTIGVLKNLIEHYPDNTSFGFRNQPIQSLYEMQHLNDTFIVFQ